MRDNLGRASCFVLRASEEKCKDEIAIFAGRGQLPKILIEDCQKNGRKFLLFLLEGEKYDIDYSAFNPVSLGYCEVEKFLNTNK